MEREDITKYAVAGVAVLALLGLIAFLWSRSGPPEPTIPPGQSIKNPFGTQGPGGPGGRPAAGAPQASGQPGAGLPRVPAPGTRDPTVGFGPSAGGPFQKRQQR